MVSSSECERNGDHGGPEHYHADTDSQGMLTGEPPECPTGQEQQEDGNAMRDEQGQSGSLMKANGIAMGKMAALANRNTPSAPFKSSAASRGRMGGSGNCINSWCNDSNASHCRRHAINGGRTLTMARRQLF